MAQRLGLEADHLLPFSAEIKSKWNFSSAPFIHFHDVHKKSPTFTLIVLNNIKLLHYNLLVLPHFQQCPSVHHPLPIDLNSRDTYFDDIFTLVPIRFCAICSALN